MLAKAKLSNRTDSGESAAVSSVGRLLSKDTVKLEVVCEEEGGGESDVESSEQGEVAGTNDSASSVKAPE